MINFNKYKILYLFLIKLKGSCNEELNKDIK